MKRQMTIRLASASTSDDQPQPIRATEWADRPAASPRELSAPSQTSVANESVLARRASRIHCAGGAEGRAYVP